MAGERLAIATHFVPIRWPSFRKAEIFSENVNILAGGEMESICSTHLGLPTPTPPLTLHSTRRGDYRVCVDMGDSLPPLYYSLYPKAIERPTYPLPLLVPFACCQLPQRFCAPPCAGTALAKWKLKPMSHYLGLGNFREARTLETLSTSSRGVSGGPKP